MKPSERKARQRFWQSSIVLSLFLFLLLLTLNACTGNLPQQQAASQAKAELDSLIAQARSVGVPQTLLSPIQDQETQLSSSRAPVSFFSDQPLVQYYENLTQRYQQLCTQVEGL